MPFVREYFNQFQYIFAYCFLHFITINSVLINETSSTEFIKCV